MSRAIILAVALLAWPALAHFEGAEWRFLDEIKREPKT